MGFPGRGYSQLQVLAIRVLKRGIIKWVDNRVRHRGAVPPGLKKSNLAEFSQGETEKSYLNPEFRGAGVAASYGHETFVLCSKIP